jgi:hypothetical protein
MANISTALIREGKSETMACTESQGQVASNGRLAHWRRARFMPEPVLAPRFAVRPVASPSRSPDSVRATLSILHTSIFEQLQSTHAGRRSL